MGSLGGWFVLLLVVGWEGRKEVGVMDLSPLLLPLLIRVYLGIGINELLQVWR